MVIDEIKGGLRRNLLPGPRLEEKESPDEDIIWPTENIRIQTIDQTVVLYLCQIN